MNYQILDTIKQAGRSKLVLRIIYREKMEVMRGGDISNHIAFRGEGENEALFAWDIEKMV